ncbi:MAG TPA: flagellar regulator YcgR PilZN domain-containing protein [Acidobacteriaceae bacterium]|jgi:c-di-GMP-binding flagellar brake protein YcgR
MQQDGTVLANSVEGTHDAHRVTRPSDVIYLLQEIYREQRSVVLMLGRGVKVVTMLLEVDEASGRFVYDVGRTLEETQAILSASQVRFAAELRGVSVRFAVQTPVHVMSAGAPAFASPVPAEILYLQRREHYRASTRLNRSYPCFIRLADQTEVTLNIYDISLGGVRLHSNLIPPQKLPIGTLLRGALLDFLELGKLEVAMRVVSHRKSENEGIPNYLYGCQFQQLPRGKDAAIQKLVFSLERLDPSNGRA